MYNMHPNFGLQNSGEKKFLCIICTDFLEFVEAKLNLSLVIFTNPSARAGYDTRSIFKRNLTGLNSEFSFS